MGHRSDSREPVYSSAGEVLVVVAIDDGLVLNQLNAVDVRVLCSFKALRSAASIVCADLIYSAALFLDRRQRCMRPSLIPHSTQCRIISSSCTPYPQCSVSRRRSVTKAAILSP